MTLPSQRFLVELGEKGVPTVPTRLMLKGTPKGA